MQYVVSDFAYSPLRKGYDLIASDRTQVLFLPLRLNTPSEEFYRTSDGTLHVTPSFQNVPRDALVECANAIISELKACIKGKRPKCGVDVAKNAWKRFILPQVGISSSTLPPALVSVRVSNEDLEQRSKSQLTTAH